MMVPRTAGFAIASVTVTGTIVLIGVLIFYGVFFSNPRKAEAASGSQTFNSSGSFVVPTYVTLTVEMWGGGGGGGASGPSLVAGSAGTASTFQTLSAGGGAGGPGGYGSFIGGGAGGTASGGDTNTSGQNGGSSTYTGGIGGTAPGSGGAGGAGAVCNYNTGTGGTVPGGGGGGGGGLCSSQAGGGGGGSGAYVVKSYSVGQLTPGANLTVTVGGGGTRGSQNSAGGNGAAGRVRITWTDNLPGAPGTPTFTTITQTSMRVNWTAASGATSYKVERCAGVGCSSFSQVVSGVGALFYDDTGLTTGQSYSYRIRATNSYGDGAYGGTGTQITGSVPGTPGTPSFSSVTATGMSVTWTPASGAATYKVERCQGAGCSNFVQVAAGLNTPLFSDAGLSPGTSYTYRVRGTNVSGDGAYSASATQITGTTGTGSSISITGWGWSDNIGWIAMNCVNGGPTGNDICGSNNFGLIVSPTTGAVSGYAWSDNIGWISANSADLTGCPSAPCSTTLTTSALTGWLKAISGGSSQSGGWDGFIALNDMNTGDAFTYGISYSGGIFSGFGWGDTNVGWVDFALARSTYNLCTPSTTYSCSSGTVIRRTVQTANCETTITDPYLTCIAPQFCSVGSPVCITPSVDGFASGGLTGHLLARPNLIARNGTSTIYWGVYNVQPNSCSVTTDDGAAIWTGAFSATSSCPTKYGTGCTSQPITRQTTYRLSCLDFDGNNYVETATVNLLPEFQER